MVHREHHTELLIVITFYFILISCCAYWAQRRQAFMKNSGISDRLSSHYLGGRAIGPLVTTGTIFASFYSGYTIVGIPNEAYKKGWIALRWVAAGFTIITGYWGTGLRLRKAGLVRNHQTPVDFITDRFQSQVLRYTVLFLQVIPALIYITAQVVALKNTFNSIFELEENSSYPVVIIMALTLLFEWIGGFNSVAFTDCVQGFIMLIAYVSLPIILLRNFGGWNELNPETYPKPEFYQTPSKGSQLEFWQFTIHTFSFFTLPHLMQRTYAARDLFSLKCAYVTLTGGMWFMMMVGVFIGTVGVQILDGEEVMSPFTSILEHVIELGGFAKGIGLIAVTATLAAIMSTADSLLISISQIITEEIVYPMFPEATPQDMAWVGRAVSFIAVFVSTLLGLSWDKGITDLASLNFQLSFQVAFIFLVGLFATNKTDFHPWCLSFGAILSSIYVFGLFFGYVKINMDKNVIHICVGVSGIALQLIISCTSEWFRRRYLSFDEFDLTKKLSRRPSNTSLSNGGFGQDQVHLLFPYRPNWDIPSRKRFGEYALTPDLLWKMMKGVKEPLTSVHFSMLMFLSISFITPILVPGLPEDPVSSPFVNGIPWWAFKMLLIAILPSLLLVVHILYMQHDYPSIFKLQKNDLANQSTNSPSGARITNNNDNHNHNYYDPQILELTREELGHRVAYDKQNELVAKRRRELMEQLGMSPSEIFDFANDTSRDENTTTSSDESVIKSSPKVL